MSGTRLEKRALTTVLLPLEKVTVDNLCVLGLKPWGGLIPKVAPEHLEVLV